MAVGECHMHLTRLEYHLCAPHVPNSLIELINYLVAYHSIPLKKQLVLKLYNQKLGTSAAT